MALPAPAKMGAVAPGSTTDNAPRTLKAAIGVPLRLVSGYKGTSEIRLAAENGEVSGACWGWGSLRSTWRKALETGEVVVVLQAGPKPHSDLPSVPNAISLAKTDEARKLIEIAIHTDSAMVRSFTLPPGTPKDRVQTLRKAFLATLRDPAFLAEADKAKLEVEPITGEAIEGHVDRLFKLEPAMVAKLKTVLLE
jgi:tripartite-type tricarboxylate transporter receptor subunit TctC